MTIEELKIYRCKNCGHAVFYKLWLGYNYFHLAYMAFGEKGIEELAKKGFAQLCPVKDCYCKKPEPRFIP